MQHGHVWTSCAVVIAVLAIVGSLLLSTYWSSVELFLDRITYEWFIEDCMDLGPVVPVNKSVGDVHVVYASDAQGFQFLLNSLVSLGRHTTAEQCHIHIVVSPAEIDAAESMLTCFRAALGGATPRVSLHELRELPYDLEDFRSVWEEVWPLGARRFLTPVVFVRLHLHEYFPDLSRVVWLDSDTIVRSDVGELYRMEMQSPLAAALDMKWVTWGSEYANELNRVDESLLDGIGLDERTLNSGVLVFDLDRWRAEGIGDRLMALLRRTRGVKDVQLLLNLAFRDNFDRLDWRWNVMGLMLVPPQRCTDGAHILHWAGQRKPWHLDLPPRLEGLYTELLGSRLSCPGIQNSIDAHGKIT